MKNVLKAISLSVVVICATAHLQANEASASADEFKALRKEVKQMQKAHKALARDLKQKKTAAPDGDYAALQAQVDESRAALKAKKQELKQMRQERKALAGTSESKQKPAKAKKKSKQVAMQEPTVKYPGDLTLKDGTVLRKVTVHQVSKDKIVLSDNRKANREVAVSDLTDASKAQLKL